MAAAGMAAPGFESSETVQLQKTVGTCVLHNNPAVFTFLAPARRTMSTIWLMVVPRTMLSSTSSTDLSLNTAGIALSFRRTLSSRVRCRAGISVSWS